MCLSGGAPEGQPAQRSRQVAPLVGRIGWVCPAYRSTLRLSNRPSSSDTGQISDPVTPPITYSVAGAPRKTM